MTTAYGYTRVSTSTQAEEGVSLDAQRAAITTYCQRNGLELAHVYADEGLSGKKASNRPELQAALKASCGNRGTLVVYSLSRLCRSTRDALDIAERIHKAGANLVSITEAIDTSTPIGSFFFTILAALAQLERQLIGERTREALAHKKRNGEKVGGRCPFGYTVDDGKLIPCGGEQRSIARMKSLKHKGHGYKAIAAMLNDESIPTRTGAPWSAKVVRDIIIRERVTT